jgi:hypothetical protein
MKMDITLFLEKYTKKLSHPGIIRRIYSKQVLNLINKSKGRMERHYEAYLVGSQERTMHPIIAMQKY